MNIQNAKLEQRAIQVESQLSSYTQADTRSQVSSQLQHHTTNPAGATTNDPCKKCESLLIAQGLSMQQLAKLKTQNEKLKQKVQSLSNLEKGFFS